MDKESDLSAQAPQTIRHQIESTRSSLSEKLHTLEQGVRDTVEGAKTAVVDTVETVKHTVENTVASVRGTVQGTVDSVKQTFDLNYQVKEHPWPMFGGAVATGYVIGALIPKEHWVSRAMSHSPEIPQHFHDGPQAGMGSYQRATVGQEPSPSAGIGQASSNSGQSDSADPGWAATFAPELHKLKGLAIGTLFAVLREMINKSTPEPLVPQVQEMVNSITTKMGGEVIRGPFLDK